MAERSPRSFRDHQQHRDPSYHRSSSNSSRSRNSHRAYQQPQSDTESCFYKTKEFLRKLVAFLFGHVGICGLVVGYIIMGAFAFMAIESEDTKKRYEDVVRVRDETIRNLWNITNELNVLYPDEWNASVALQVLDFQRAIVQFVLEGYDGKAVGSNLTRSRDPGGTEIDPTVVEVASAWSFSASFLYCLTVITTIGYGNIAPRTVMGKMVTIAYAMVGMPLFLLYVSNMGDFLATCFRWGYVNLCKCSCLGRSGRHGHQQRNGPRRRTSQRGGEQQQQHYDVHHRSRIHPPDDFELHHHHNHAPVEEHHGAASTVDYTTATVPITISLAVMVSYVIGGAVLFQQWETEWNYLDGSYFCFISLSTTGFGDLVPGDSLINSASGGVELSLIFCSMYLIIGMALIAMCFNLMQEEVIAKVRKLGQMLGCIKTEE